MNILKSLLTIGIGSIINIFLGLLSSPIITRLVDPIEYGQFNMFITRVGIITSFLYFGLNDALYRFFFSYEKEEDKKSLVKLCFYVPLLIAICISIIAIAIYSTGVIKFEYSIFVFILLCVNAIILFWNNIAAEIMHNCKKVKEYTLSLILQKLVYYSFIIIMILVIKNKYFLIMIFATLLANIISALIGTISTNKYWKLIGTKLPSNSKEIIKYSLPIYLYFTIYSVYDVFDKYLMKYYYGDYEVGIYAAAFSIASLLTVAQTAFGGIWRPLQTEQYTNNPNDKTFIKNGNLYATIILYFIGINVIFFKDILILFLGEKYRVGVTLIPFLIFNPIMNVLTATVTSGIEYSKKSYLRVIVMAITLICEFILANIFMDPFGYKGIAIALSLSLIIQYLLTMHFSNKYYYIDYSLKKFIIITICILCFALISLQYENIIYNLISYAVVLIIFIFVYKEDIKALIKSLIKNKNHE